MTTAWPDPLTHQCRRLADGQCVVPFSAPYDQSQACVGRLEPAKKAPHQRRKPNRFDNEVTQAIASKAVRKNQQRAKVI